jgi:hypothetical protein
MQQAGQPEVFISRRANGDVLPTNLCSRKIMPGVRRMKYALMCGKFKGAPASRLNWRSLVLIDFGDNVGCKSWALPRIAPRAVPQAPFDDMTAYPANLCRAKFPQNISHQ